MRLAADDGYRRTLGGRPLHAGPGEAVVQDPRRPPSLASTFPVTIAASLVGRHQALSDFLVGPLSVTGTFTVAVWVAVEVSPWLSVTV